MMVTVVSQRCSSSSTHLQCTISELAICASCSFVAGLVVYRGGVNAEKKALVLCGCVRLGAGRPASAASPGLATTLRAIIIIRRLTHVTFGGYRYYSHGSILRLGNVREHLVRLYCHGFPHDSPRCSFHCQVVLCLFYIKRSTRINHVV